MDIDCSQIARCLNESARRGSPGASPVFDHDSGTELGFMNGKRGDVRFSVMCPGPPVSIVDTAYQEISSDTSSALAKKNQKADVCRGLELRTWYW